MCYTMRFIFCDCLVKHLNNIIQFLLKINLIWWDKFSCNFRYIFIDEIGFIKKKKVLVVGQINKKIELYGMGRGFAGPQGAGMRQESLFPVMQGETKMKQDKIMRGKDENPILWPHLISLSSLLLRLKYSKNVVRPLLSSPVV